ncbi:M1 family metallopeptidase [Reichenbachiella ulvae]|uniref:Aminopeptidase N n=1 Tax=Reichenbachiella ulvae TaxID=2980104 RepID=A0ABT3CZH4_9BACT|nr:M1 family metallopeptidase [Reichenbachiella ulvae]MCV9388890.1 M1 family metallopeptidase [Reichenbachiella ulvae]
MTNQRYQLLLFLVLSCFTALAQQSPDILHYRFDVTLTDASDRIQMIEQVQFRPQWADSLRLDLDESMTVASLSLDGEELPFVHENDQVVIPLPESNEAMELGLTYSGEPQDGLIISRNEYGRRTFFSDHWPNRAHYWLAVVDHPTEKASCEFVVTAPSQYSVVSNGLLQSEESLDGNAKKTHWKMKHPIPTKVMAMGVADFEVNELDSLSKTWLYRYGGRDYKTDFLEANKVRQFLIDQIAPYPFDKLDHVESTTKYGGMENAGCIFYRESSVNDKGEIVGLIAHEVAHQWFGNSASEAGWEHIWLSEGFATYYEYLTIKAFYGLDSMRALADEIELKIMDYEDSHPNQAVLNQNYEQLDDILNALSYDKAGWMLRMLHHYVGEDLFNQIVKTYYEKYKYSNATTDDFIAVAEQVSGQDLKFFFHQWLVVPGRPHVVCSYKFKRGVLELDFEQKSSHIYTLKIDVPVMLSHNKMEIRSVLLNERQQSFKIKDVLIEGKPNLDPLNLIYGFIEIK